MRIRRLPLTLCLGFLGLPAVHAAEAWDSAPFTAPASELMQAASAVTRERPTSVVVLLDERRFVFDEQHRLTRTSRLVYRVDSPDGVERWAASSSRWQPWHQARPSIQARVITPDGHEHHLDENLLHDAGTRSDSSQVYDDDHVLEGPLPAIAIGAVVEEQITVRDEKPFFAAESLPLKRITRLLPNAQVNEVRANGRVRWTLEQGVIDEMDAMDSNLPADEPAWPAVEFSSGASWQAVADAYRGMTESRIRNDDAKPLIAGLSPRTNKLEYVARVVERLHREVRYTGVEFGTERLIPEYPSETLRRRFGDCKDKSTLLVAALRASGIDAYLALLSAGDDQDVEPGLPGLGLFDHAIVFVPGLGANGA